MKKKLPEYTLSDTDVQAIIAALPLILLVETDTEEQYELNEICCELAAAKLIAKSTGFTANELRVIYSSVALANQYLAGKWDLDVTAEEKEELKKYMFTYIKLEKALAPHFPHL